MSEKMRSNEQRGDPDGKGQEKLPAVSAGKRILLRTFGCQMNVRDSELVVGVLLKNGYTLAESEEDADVILFNTCSVREHAENKVWSEIGKLKKWKDSFPPKVVGLIGCMAQNYQHLAFQHSSLLDLVVGPNNIDAIAELIEKNLRESEKVLAVDRLRRLDTVYNSEYISDKSHCNVIIMEGCDNFCSYCIVPYVRGRERSRPTEDIIREIEQLVKRDIKNITLLGQNVNSYQGASVNFAELLRMVNEIDGLKKFDFVTSHPKDAGVKLFKTMAELPKLKKFLHLPLQSGSNRILKLMNRGYTRSHYIKLAKQAKKIIPDLRLTTDVMVGFPTETDKDFQDTFDLMKEVQFDAAYIFKYSPRPYTQAAKIADDVPVEVKKQRNQILLTYQKSLHNKKI